MTEESTQVADLTVEAAFDAAVAEVEGLATDTDTDTVSPTVEVEADDSIEQTEETVEEVDSEQADDTFDFEDIEEDEVDQPEALDLTTTVTVEGHGEVTLEALRNGYMMQADYTRGKQALKAEREAFAAEQEAAAKIMSSLQDDPVGLAAYLAVETGLISEADLEGKDVSALREAVRVPKAADVDAEVEKRVAEHPDIQAARVNAVKAEIEREFSTIEQTVGKPLSEAAKVKVVEYAAEHGLNDLTVAFDALSAASARKRAASAKLKAAAPERPKTRAETPEKPAQAESIEDAFALAMAQHGG
jgi:hypothetical protein